MTGIPSPLSRTVNEKVNPRDRVTVRLYERSIGVSMAVGTCTRTPAVTGVATGGTGVAMTSGSAVVLLGSGVGVAVEELVVVGDPLALVV